jgi:PAS domain-containing protein
MDRADLVGREYDSGDWTAVRDDGMEIPPDPLPFTQLLETNQAVYGYEHTIPRPGHDDLWVSANMAPIRGESGQIEYAIAVIEDVTGRRTQAWELERQIDLFRKAQDIANVGAWGYDIRTGENS